MNRTTLLLGALSGVGLIAGVLAWIAAATSTESSHVKAANARAYVFITARRAAGEWLQLKDRDETPVEMVVKEGTIVQLIHQDGYVTRMTAEAYEQDLQSRKSDNSER